MADDRNSLGSLADRITKAPDTKPSSTIGSWADEVSSPTEDKTEKMGSLAGAQTDGNAVDLGGSELLPIPSEYEVEVKLSDIQGDKDSPLYSVNSFEELGISKQILKGIYSMNFKKPSKIQEKALPILLRNPPTNMIAQSQSGTGKTAAFVLTILSRVDVNDPIPQALCLAPSRELARQIEGVVKTVGAFVDGLKVMAAVPGSVERGRSLEAHVVVGTPGTVMDLIKRRQFNANALKVLCLDEADNMLDQQGLGDQCARVKGMINKQAQILLFSATFPDQVMSFAKKFSPNAAELKLKHQELTVAGIKQMFMDCPHYEKYNVLVKLYGLMTIGSSIIFVKQRTSAAEIEARMVAEGHQVASLTGANEGSERDAVIDRFRTGEAKVLITTNVLARGIDVQSVSMVINYDIPMKGPPSRETPDAETYLHRIGRTGRFGRVGVSISFVSDQSTYSALSNIAGFYGIDLVKLSYDDWDETEEVVQRIIKSSRSGTNFKMN